MAIGRPKALRQWNKTQAELTHVMVIKTPDHNMVLEGSDVEWLAARAVTYLLGVEFDISKDRKRLKAWKKGGEPKVWNQSKDRMLLRDYHKMSTAALARQLSERFKFQCTKNMVIGRYHRLTKKASSRRPKGLGSETTWPQRT